MNVVKVLIQGYAHPGPRNTYVASPSCTLIISSGKKILVDPGANQELLSSRLKKEGLMPKNKPLSP